MNLYNNNYYVNYNRKRRIKKWKGITVKDMVVVHDLVMDGEEEEAEEYMIMYREEDVVEEQNEVQWVQ